MSSAPPVGRPTRFNFSSPAEQSNAVQTMEPEGKLSESESNPEPAVVDQEALDEYERLLLSVESTAESIDAVASNGLPPCHSAAELDAEMAKIVESETHRAQRDAAAFARQAREASMERERQESSWQLPQDWDVARIEKMVARIDADPSHRAAKIRQLASQRRPAAQLKLMAQNSLRKIATARQLTLTREQAALNENATPTDKGK